MKQFFSSVLIFLNLILKFLQRFKTLSNKVNSVALIKTSQIKIARAHDRKIRPLYFLLHNLCSQLIFYPGNIVTNWTILIFDDRCSLFFHINTLCMKKCLTRKKFDQSEFFLLSSLIVLEIFFLTDTHFPFCFDAN